MKNYDFSMKEINNFYRLIANNVKNDLPIDNIRGTCIKSKDIPEDYTEIPSLEEVKQDKKKFIEMFHVFYQNGRMYIDGRYKADLKHGVWNFYDKKGKLEKTIEYINGIATNQDELDSIQDAQIREWESQKGKFKEPDVNRFYNPQR